MQRIPALGTLAWLIAFAGPVQAQDLTPGVRDLIENLHPTAGRRTRGIRMPAQKPPAKPAPAAGSALATTAAPADAPTVSLTITFVTGSAELAPAAIQVLGNLTRALASPQLAPYRFRIEGHTDSVGPRRPNQELSERRAAQVRDYLVRHGIAAARLEAVGPGEQQLLIPTPDETAEPRNRRVQILNLGS
jgi:OmpA-OmpF porin, OOP family